MVFMDTAATIPTGSMAERLKFIGFVADELVGQHVHLSAGRRLDLGRRLVAEPRPYRSDLAMAQWISPVQVRCI